MILVSLLDCVFSSTNPSTEIQMAGHQLIGLITPGTLTSTAITFQASNVSGGTFVPVKDKTGAAISLTVTTSSYYALDPNLIQAPVIKLVPGSSEGAARTIIVVLKPVLS